MSISVLLSKHSLLTLLVISDYHRRLSHAGIYSVLSEIRKHFGISHSFSLVKKVFKKCVRCRRFNNRAVSVNQNIYRDFRLSPPNIPL